jgi:hypothetical protein
VSQYDAVGWSEEANTDEAGGVRQPEWIREGLTLRRRVEWEEGALANVPEKAFRKAKFYKDAGALERVVTEVLASDVRSKWHTKKARKGGSRAPVVGAGGERLGERGEGRDEEGGGGERGKEGEASSWQIDNFIVEFIVDESEDVNGVGARGELLEGMVDGSGANDVVRVTNVLGVVC